jgi:hypothetical protein
MRPIFSDDVESCKLKSNVNLCRVEHLLTTISKDDNNNKGISIDTNVSLLLLIGLY